MPEVFLTRHAIKRYRERVADVPAADILRSLDCRAVRAAINFGARFVRLAGGQRVVLEENRVVTILPRDIHVSRIRWGQDVVANEGEGHAEG